jgi:hypothetical protein
MAACILTKAMMIMISAGKDMNPSIWLMTPANVNSSDVGLFERRFRAHEQESTVIQKAPSE